MNRREHTLTLEPATGPCAAVVDERGRLQGWTTAFAERGGAGNDLAGRSIADFLPEIDADRWAAIWRNVQNDEVERLGFGRPGRGDDDLQLIEVEVCKFVDRGMCLAKVEVSHGGGANAELRILQQEILEGMATGVALPEIMELLCRRAEVLAPSVICSVLAVDRDGRLQHLASPSLPDDYSRAIDGVSIGPKVGSCGTAAFRGEPVEVTDIASDPLWEDYKYLAFPWACAPVGRARSSRAAAAFWEPSPFIFRCPGARWRSSGKSWRRVCTFVQSRSITSRRASVSTSSLFAIR